MTLQTYDHEGEKNSCWCDECGGYHSGKCPPLVSILCHAKDHRTCRYAWCECECHDDDEVSQ